VVSALDAERAARAAALLSRLPVGRSCGLTPALATDAAALVVGRRPAPRIAVSGPSPAAGRLLTWLQEQVEHLPRSPGDPAPVCSDRPAGSHLLLFAVPDLPSEPDAGALAAAGPALAVLGGPHPPRGVAVVTAADDWDGVGLDVVAGWHRRWLRPWWGPAAAGLPVHAVVLDQYRDRHRDRYPESGLPALLRDTVPPASAVAALTTARLRSALQELRLACADQQQHDAGPPPPDPELRAALWRRLDAVAAGPPALRAIRHLDAALRGCAHPTTVPTTTVPTTAEERP
jgi:hypothetical protein